MPTQIKVKLQKSQGQKKKKNILPNKRMKNIFTHSDVTEPVHMILQDLII